MKESWILVERHGVWYLSIGFFVFVLVWSIILYGMQFFAERRISSLEEKQQEIQTKIQSASKDEKIIVARIIEQNWVRPSLDLVGIIRNFRSVAVASNVTLDGFSIKDDVISTNLISTQGNQVHPDAVATIINMMNQFSNGEQVFRLGKIRTVSGTPNKRTTSIELTVSTPQP